jgi:hypothetical protein
MNPCRLLSLYVGLALFLVAAPSLFPAAQPYARTILDASVDAVWDATIASLRDTGYKVSEERRARGSVSGRRTRLVGRMKEDDAAKELKQICRTAPRVGIDVRGMSEYYVTLTARIGSSEHGKTGIDVVAKITAVFRRRGGAGAPMPVALDSNGALEEELLQRVRERLAHGPSEQTPPQP